MIYYLVAQSLSVLAPRLVLVLLLLKLDRMHLPRVPIADQRIVSDCERPQVSGMRLSGDERVRRRLYHNNQKGDRKLIKHVIIVEAGRPGRVVVNVELITAVGL